MAKSKPSQPGNPSVESGEGALVRQGRLMFARYRLQRLLGRGGMGVVWLAHDDKLDRLAALKFLPEIFLGDAAARDDMKNETRRSLELTHPNIVRIYDFVEDEEAAAISMEYVDGSTLSQLRVQRPQRCFEAEGLHSWVADLCGALDYAHRVCCVVHRDLKPANLMITARGNLKVADFGISRGLHHTVSRLSSWNAASGTLGYASPQQTEGEIPSEADDIYSFGAIIYELLTSKPPFFLGDLNLQTRTIVPEKMAERRTKLGVVGEPIPNGWEETIAACLAKRAGDRPSTVLEIARLLGVEMERATAPSDPETTKITPSITTPEPSPPAKSGEGNSNWTNSAHWAYRMATLRRRPWASLGVGAAVIPLAIAIWSHTRDASPQKTGPAPFSNVAKSANVADAAKAENPLLKEESETGTGGMMVKTNPPGAEAAVDGAAAANTPASFPALKVGAHSLRIQLRGFEPISSQVQVRPNQFTDLGVIALQRSVGDLQITSDPEGSTFVLLAATGEQEICRGETPETVSRLPTGDYRLRVMHPGWPDVEQAVVIEREATRVVSNRFGLGTVQVTTDPPGAEIFSAGKSLGRTPLSIQLPSGHYASLTAQLADFQSESFSVDVKPEETAIVPVMALKSRPAALSLTTTPPGIPFKIYSEGGEAPSSKALRTGESPADVDGLAPGAYRVVLGGDRWPSRSVSFQVGDRGKTTLSQDFPFATLNIDSRPPGADIFEGEVLLGKTPASIAIAPGSHALSAVLEGRKSGLRTFVLTADQTKSISFDFKMNANAGGEGTSVHHSHKPKKKPDDSELTKIGRSLKNFFTGTPSKKKDD